MFNQHRPRKNTIVLNTLGMALHLTKKCYWSWGSDGTRLCGWWTFIIWRRSVTGRLLTRFWRHMFVWSVDIHHLTKKCYRLTPNGVLIIPRTMFLAYCFVSRTRYSLTTHTSVLRLHAFWFRWDVEKLVKAGNAWDETSRDLTWTHTKDRPRVDLHLKL